MPCCCCFPRRSCRSSVASWSCQKSSRLRVIAARIDPFSLLISLYNATKLVLLSVFTSNLETICYKRCSKSLLKNTKIPRRVDARRLKTSLLKTWGGLRPKIVQPLTLLYTIFDRKGTPFFVYLLFFNCCKCKVWSLKYDKITKQ